MERANCQRLHGALLALVFLASPAPQAAQIAPDGADPRIQTLVASISEERLRQLDEKLVSFGTRNTLSDAASATRGIGAARQWIYDELRRSSPRLQVSFDTHQLAQQGRITRPVELRNVMAVLPGRSLRRIYVSAHYDSLNLGPGAQAADNARPVAGPAVPDIQQRPEYDHNVDAPGANDDGSGTVLTMELARVLSESGITFEQRWSCLLGRREQGLSVARTCAVAAGRGPRCRRGVQQRHCRQLDWRQWRQGFRERARLRGRT
jgi:acetylornithine deacetylase/succinyl-diaminopimelate desuccinylase-like protein